MSHRPTVAPRPSLDGVGIHVEALDDGTVLFSNDAEVFRPSASLGKLLTGYVALRRLGRDHRGVTEVYADAPPRAGELSSLYLRGGGDTTLVERDLAAIARRLRERGLRRIRGPVVADPGNIFDPLPAPAGPATDPTYRSPVTPLMLGYGTIYVGVKPRLGLRPRVVVPFGAEIRVENRARFGLRSDNLRIEWHEEESGTARIVVDGSWRPSKRKVVRYFPSLEGPRYAGRTMLHFLQTVGITVERPECVVGATPESAILFEQHAGRSLGEAVRAMMKNSINGVADALVKWLGRGPEGAQGTYERGLAVLREEASAIGLDADPSRLVSGSGLRRDNVVRPKDVVRLLRAAWNDPTLRNDFFDALPILGVDGTLREHRPPPPGARLVAKTGSVRGICALAGIAEPPSGKPRLFSLTIEEPDPSRWRARVEAWESYLLSEALR